MSKFDDSYKKMMHLMDYKMPVNEKKSNVEYCAEGADGKVYGILREGTKFYIKVTEKGKEKLSESYGYLGGFMRKNDNAYSSYNEATKQLEMKLMSLNEAYGRTYKSSVFDSEKNKKTLEFLTEEARKELNRMHLVLENSMNIGAKVYNGEDEESNGKATDPVAQSSPFEEKSKYEEEGTKETESNPENANEDYTEVKNVEKVLEKGEPCGNCSTTKNDTEKAKCDLDGKGVAVNEGILDAEVGDDIILDDEEIGFEDDIEGGIADSIEDEPIALDDTEAVEDDSLVGIDNGDDMELDGLLEEYEDFINGAECGVNEDYCEKTVVAVVDNSCEKSEATNTNIECGNETLDGPHGSSEVLSWDKINESIKRVSKKAFNKALKEESMKRKLKKIVMEEMINLGYKDHPRYGVQPMSTPKNVEKFVNDGDYDMNDDSTKGQECYGKKIGDSAPFNKKVDVLTDSVMKVLNEKLKLKKNK